MSSLINTILSIGVKNCRFLVEMRKPRALPGITAATGLGIISSSDPTYLILAEISEERYKLTDGYKITLKSTSPEFGSEHYYTSDLQSLIKDGHVKFFRRVNSDDIIDVEDSVNETCLCEVPLFFTKTILGIPYKKIPTAAPMLARITDKRKEKYILTSANHPELTASYTRRELEEMIYCDEGACYCEQKITKLESIPQESK